MIAHEHNKACITIEKWADINLIRPSFQIVTKTTRSAGRFNHQSHECIYPLAYALIAKHKYIETIHHEVVHGYQYQLMPTCTVHGEFFYFLMQHVMQYETVKHRHYFSVSKAKILGKILQVYYDKDFMQKLQTNAKLSICAL